MGLNDDDYLAFCFDEAAFKLEVKATDSEGKTNWERIKWKDKTVKDNKAFMKFIGGGANASR